MSNQLKEFIDAAEALVDNNPLELTALIAKTLKEKFPLLLDDVGETNGDQVLGLGVVSGCTDYDLPQYGYSEEDTEILGCIQGYMQNCPLYSAFVGWNKDRKNEGFNIIKNNAVEYMKKLGFIVFINVDNDVPVDDCPITYVYIDLGAAVLKL